MKHRLFTPGPTTVPERVMLRMAEPLIHHRTPEFRAIMRRVNANLQYLFQTTAPVVTLCCSGTGGVEATFVNLFNPGDTVIAVNGGKFGGRWAAMPRVFGLRSVEIVNAWGTAPRAGEIAEALRQHPDAAAVYLTQNETSTGTAADIRTLARVIRDESNALVCVDGVSSVGAMELRFDEWGIDACVTASQKGLMVPPGLAFVALSGRARDAVARSTMPRLYFDLARALETWERGDTPWTPAVSLLAGADAALAMIRGEGIENVWVRHARQSAALRAGIAALGLRLVSASPSQGVTAVWLPMGVGWEEFRGVLSGTTGVVVAGGQGDFQGKIFRIAHLGYYDDPDIVAVISALEETLAILGVAHDRGAGVAAARKAFADGGARSSQNTQERTP